eukprot:tig00020675_g12706.t1
MRQAIDAGVMLTSVHPSAPRRAEPMKKKKKKKKNDPKEPSARGSGQRLTRLSAALDGALDRVKEIGHELRRTWAAARHGPDSTPCRPAGSSTTMCFLAWVSALDKKVDLHIRGFETKRILRAANARAACQS